MGMSDDRFRECAVIRAIPYRVKVEDAKLPAFTEFDGDGEFITPPDFGCTLWEANVYESKPPPSAGEIARAYNEAVKSLPPKSWQELWERVNGMFK
jgi:hypothetical protein